ncbi:tumor necrosis factor receptor superfamily member 13C [Mauremys reevesii]|uniref:tumor necrosis factor receptor superfamily member 13C n=1 Tax=Mauremys reevesii TaxID=260615 RepID=UPI00193F82CF|nr:tumor necrosis factor receptor superfamily member 13C [Mauremys reevesii]XP_039347594.1 tumor necrosis factor receptor superfamily member 13C [Mauremys reevesii]XP_039347602.1 tumor necrosis factor receptor superfamily member 13C [Mauremys reevesii]XP_039347609.1 tumor necrosis factor receptor superfamily member 13C [Mauremys reevesii]XP_039347620.1 tumor necrosis factor receptor superfamily member 13C [Mauremys reevesii]XP_039347628.1 tumor necrosis factor receptor superfamily member 13C [
MARGSLDRHQDTACLLPQCFDPLIKGCVRCTDLPGHSEEDTIPSTACHTSVAPTSTQAPAPGPGLIFGIPALVGLVLVLAALCGLLTCKVRRRRQRKKRSPDEKPKENLDCVISCESQACKGPKLPEDDLVLATCPHVNGALKHAGPAGRGDFSKRKPVFQGGTGSDVIELSGLSASNEERDHGFPLPATELGATVLVTTKTIQNNCLTEERP